MVDQFFEARNSLVFLGGTLNRNMDKQSIAEQRDELRYPDRLRRATRRFIAEWKPSCQYAVTLTLKQVTKRNAVDDRLNPHGYSVPVTLNEMDAPRIARGFIYQLNYSIFGRCGMRKKRSVDYLFALEGRKPHERLHLHIAIRQTPEWLRYFEFWDHARTAAKKTDWVYHHVKATPGDDFWQQFYITKEVGRRDTDALLW